jgi:DNA-binding protein HU-beta
MHKEELSKAVAREIERLRTDDSPQKRPPEDTPRQASEKAIKAIFECIAEALKNGEEVKLIGFGTFKTSLRKATIGRNPRSGEAINIPAKKVVKFVPGLALKEAANTGETSK